MPDKEILSETLEAKTVIRQRQPNARRVYLDPSTPSVRSIARVVIITLLILFVANRIENIIGALTFLTFLVIISIFFAYLIDPIVRLIRRPFEATKFEKFMPRSAAIIITYVLVGAILGAVIASIAPKVIEQGKEFGANFPAYATGIQQGFNDLNRRFDRLRVPEDVQAKINEQALGMGERVTAGFGNFIIGAITYLPWLIIIPVFAFFFLKDVNSFRIVVLRMFPAGRWRSRAESVLQDVNTTLAAYIRAQLISCLLIGTLCTIGFYLIGLKYALLLGIVAAIFEFIPLIGPLTIAIIVVLTSAFSDEPTNAIYVAIFLIALRIAQDYIFYPRIVRGGIELHPVVIILSVLAGEQAAGIPGVFISIPIVAICTVFYRHIVEHQGGRGMFARLIESEENAVKEQA
ncbi:MAG: AI-2E family transporter [Pyrinomonadaceae bacterium]